MRNIIEEIDLTKWKKKTVILHELSKKNIYINERVFRELIRKHNEKYINNIVDTYIAHDNNKGYIQTKDKMIIKRSLHDNKVRGIDQIVLYSKGLKAIGEWENEKLNLQEEIFNE